MIVIFFSLSRVCTQWIWITFKWSQKKKTHERISFVSKIELNERFTRRTKVWKEKKRNRNTHEMQTTKIQERRWKLHENVYNIQNQINSTINDYFIYFVESFFFGYKQLTIWKTCFSLFRFWWSFNEFGIALVLECVPDHSAKLL